MIPSSATDRDPALVFEVADSGNPGPLVRLFSSIQKRAFEGAINAALGVTPRSV